MRPRVYIGRDLALLKELYDSNFPTLAARIAETNVKRYDWLIHQRTTEAEELESIVSVILSTK